MTTLPPGKVDQAIKYARILPSHKVATMGNCFAQHLAKHIRAFGLNYNAPELAPLGMSELLATQKLW